MKRRKKRKDQKKERIKIELNSQKKYQIIAFVCLLGNYNEVVINYKKQRTKQKIIFKDQQYGEIIA